MLPQPATNQVLQKYGYYAAIFFVHAGNMHVWSNKNAGIYTLKWVFYADYCLSSFHSRKVCPKFSRFDEIVQEFFLLPAN